MKLSVLQEDFLRGLTSVSRFVSPRAQLPVLSNILFSTQKGKLKLAATNLEMGVSLEVGAKVEKEGETTVPARMVVELISNMPPAKIDVEAKEGALSFSSGGFSGSLATIPANEFPAIPSSGKNGVGLRGETLDILSRKVTFAASTDDSRPVLTGTLLVFGEKLTAVSTDGFRLSYKEISVEEKKKEKEERLLVPAKAIEEMSRTLDGQEEKVQISFSEKEGQILFSGGPAVLTSRLLAGDFPDYQKIVPVKTTYEMRAEKEDLVRAVKAAAVFAREAASIVKLKVEEGRVVVAAESQQYGKEEAAVDAKTEGGELEVAFNYRYLLDFLGSTDGDEIVFRTEGATAPGLFQENKDDSYKHLIMPVRLQD